MSDPELVVTITRDHHGQIAINWPESHPAPDTVYACTAEFLQGAVEAHNATHAGADPTPVEDGVYPSPGQLWHYLLNLDAEARRIRLAHLIAASETTMACHQQSHTEQIRDLTQALSTGAHARTEATTAEAERWYVSCGCDTHGDHLGCRPQCIALLGCRHVIGVDYSAPTRAEADDHVHSMRCAVRQGPLGAPGITEHHTEDTR